MAPRVRLCGVCWSAVGEGSRVLRIRNRFPKSSPVHIQCTHVCWKGPRVHSRQPVQNEHTELKVKDCPSPYSETLSTRPETWVAFSLLKIEAGAYLMTCIFLAPTIQKIETTLETSLSSPKPMSYCVFFQNLLISKCIWHQIKRIIRSTQGLRKMSMWIFSD